MYLQSLNQFPEKPTYAIMTIQSISIPGDERSRTAPGHGYPARVEYFPELQIFSDEEEWKAAIQKLSYGTYSRKDYKAFVLKPVEIEFKVDMKIVDKD